MKIFFMGIVLFLVSETMGQKVIEHTRVGSKTTETRAISRIEWSDTATILYVDARYRPRWWIKVGSDEYICPAQGGEKLKLKAAEGIPVDKEFFMPASGQYSFKLIFPPLPEGTQYMDWMLGGGAGLFDVALTDQPEKRLFPEALLGNWLNAQGEWKYSFEKRFAMADGNFWDYKEVKTKGRFTEFHLKKGEQEKRIFASVDQEGKVKIGSAKKNMAPYVGKQTVVTLTDEGEGFERPLLKRDTAVLKGFIKGYAPKMGKQEGTIFVDNVLSGNQESFLVDIEEDGRFEFKTVLNFPQSLLLRFPYRINYSVFMGPGDTTLVCLDMAQFIDPWREAEDVGDREKTSLFAGAYARLNDELQRCRSFLHTDYRALQHQLKKQTLKEFKQSVLQQGEKALQALKEYKLQHGLSKAGEEVLTWEFKLRCCNTILDCNYMLESNWREENEKKKPEERTPFRRPETGADFYDFVRELDLGDEAPVVTGGTFGTTVNRIKFSDPVRKSARNGMEGLDIGNALQKKGVDLTETETEFFETMRQFQRMEKPDTVQVRQADEKYREVARSVFTKYSSELQEIMNEFFQRNKTGVLKEYFNLEPGFVTEVMQLQDRLQLLNQDLEVMDPGELEEVQKTYDHPFLKDYLAYCNEQLKLKLEANKHKAGYMVHPVPEVENEKLFEAIAAEFKGKVVFVDFWATWCAPCRQGILKMKPVKEALAGEEIVFVYITGETSPLKTYENMIPDIKGHHFRLSDEQWKYICGQFGVNGIPHYMVVGRDGKIIEKKFDGWQDQPAIKAALLNYLGKK